MSPARRRTRVVLLGPGPTAEGLEAVFKDAAPRGSVATIRAGWQEWESEPSLVTDVLGDRAVPLELHRRAEIVWRDDPELMEAHRAMQRDVRLLRRAYNIRLSATMDAWEELHRQHDPDDLLAPERAAALETIRELDAHQCRRIAKTRQAFAEGLDLAGRPAVARERREITALLAQSPAVFVDGGHVAVLLNRIRLFGIDEQLAGKTIVAVSGGAMVLSDCLVLFHDSPPWGPGHAEAAESGLGLAPDVVVLPHAARRLRLDDAGRVGRLARRFAPAECLVLDDGVRLDWDGRRWSKSGGRRFTPDGEVASRGAAA